jgi:hypothetical protein
MTVLPKGKSHGLVLLLDKSGSMRDNMPGSIEQILILTAFCRKVNIPFVVYSFSDYDHARRMDVTDVVYDKEKMTPDVIDFCSSTHNQSALSITWVLKKDLFPEERTVFIPQSMTHEWGHFIVEFENTTEGQLCHGLFLIHEEEPQSEDLATKIKLMKRVLERVFPDFENNIYKEYIRFDDEMFISDIKDNLIEQMSFDYPTLKFIGQAAPMKPQFAQEKFLARVLLS